MILEKIISIKMNKNEVKKMGSVIYLHERNKKINTELEDITSGIALNEIIEPLLAADMQERMKTL